MKEVATTEPQSSHHSIGISRSKQSSCHGGVASFLGKDNSQTEDYEDGIVELLQEARQKKEVKPGIFLAAG